MQLQVCMILLCDFGLLHTRNVCVCVCMTIRVMIHNFPCEDALTQLYVHASFGGSGSMHVANVHYMHVANVHYMHVADVHYCQHIQKISIYSVCIPAR